MKVQWDRLAFGEFRRAINYWNEQRRGLGIQFRGEVDDVLARVVNDPTSYECLDRDLRVHRCNTTKFSYSVIYRLLQDDQIAILAIAHTSRRFEYWTDCVEPDKPQE